MPAVARKPGPAGRLGARRHHVTVRFLAPARRPLRTRTPRAPRSAPCDTATRRARVPRARPCFTTQPWNKCQARRHLVHAARHDELPDHLAQLSMAVFESAACLLYIMSESDNEHQLSYPIGTPEYWTQLSWVSYLPTYCFPRATSLRSKSLLTIALCKKSALVAGRRPRAHASCIARRSTSAGMPQNRCRSRSGTARRSVDVSTMTWTNGGPPRHLWPGTV